MFDHQIVDKPSVTQGEVMGEERPSVEIHFTLRQESQRPASPAPPAPTQPETDNTDELLLPSTERLEVEQDLRAEREARVPSPRVPSPPLSPRLSPSPPGSPPPPSVRVTQGTYYRYCFGGNQDTGKRNAHAAVLP